MKTIILILLTIVFQNQVFAAVVSKSVSALCTFANRPICEQQMEAEMRAQCGTLTVDVISRSYGLGNNSVPANEYEFTDAFECINTNSQFEVSGTAGLWSAAGYIDAENNMRVRAQTLCGPALKAIQVTPTTTTFNNNRGLYQASAMFICRQIQVKMGGLK